MQLLLVCNKTRKLFQLYVPPMSFLVLFNSCTCRKSEGAWPAQLHDVSTPKRHVVIMTFHTQCGVLTAAKEDSWDSLIRCFFYLGNLEESDQGQEPLLWFMFVTLLSGFCDWCKARAGSICQKRA